MRLPTQYPSVIAVKKQLNDSRNSKIMCASKGRNYDHS